jgi:hypothetical protein
MVEKNDFSFNMKEFLRAVYGVEPTLRGAGLYNNYFKWSEMKPGSQEFEDAKTLMRARLAEEISDVAQEYELFLHEHVENTRAARMAATAPSHAQWAAIIRQQNALHRQLQQKIRLLEEIQGKRKREEERVLDDFEASLGRNPSDAPRGGGQASNRKKILNRGNEPETLLKTNGLTDSAPSKRTPFCPGKSAIKAKKRGVSTQEAGGTGDSPAASGRCFQNGHRAHLRVAGQYQKLASLQKCEHGRPFLSTQKQDPISKPQLSRELPQPAFRRAGPGHQNVKVGYSRRN